MRNEAAVIAALLSLGACASPRDVATPKLAVAAVYKESGPWQPAPVVAADAGAWWTLFGDPALNDLEARIEAGNPSLAVAVARYDQARALVRGARAEETPQIAIAAQDSRARVSAGRPLSSGAAATYDNLIVGASLSYELDLFGRVRNTVRAAKSEAGAAQADLAGVRLGLQAQLATAYFQLRELDARIALLRETRQAYQRVYDLTDARHTGGIVSGVDVSRAKTQSASAEAELQSVIAARARAEHAIAVLVGETASNFTLAAAQDLPDAPAIPAGVPSALLERRPDILAAQQRVAAANARIGAARAAFFPSIILGGTGGYQTTHGELAAKPNSYWALGPAAVSLPIFDGGARRANLAVARAEHDEAAAIYRRTSLEAFAEVEDDLATGRQLIDQVESQRQAAEAAARTRDLALERYRDGASDYLDVATAQTAALDAQRALLAVRGEQLRLAADTVRAVGGLYPAAGPASRPGQP